MDNTNTTTYYVAQIKEMLRRVPASVNAGSYDYAVAFKKLAAQAHKAVSASNPKLAVLISLNNQLSSYYAN